MNEDVQVKATLGYGALAAIGWLGVAISRLLNWRSHVVAAATMTGQIREDVLRFGGRLMVDGAFALVAMVIFAFVLYQLLRATWNNWDWATAVTGGAAVLSLMLICAQQRVIALIPFTLFPFWFLLYRPAVKRWCGVGEASVAVVPEGVGEAPVDLQREREMLNGLSQSLRVFEIERGIDTETFVTRYSLGLEEDSPDNEEWFALARLARRAQERLGTTNGDGKVRPA